MKQSKDIIEWGVIKPFFDKKYNFNSIDIETVDNELFLFGFVENGKYKYTLSNFYEVFHNFLVKSVRYNKDILTWSRYDNTHLLKLILSKIDCQKTLRKILLRVGKISPIMTYTYKTYQFTILNIIKDSMIFEIVDEGGNKKTLTIYNLKNLFTTDLETTASDYKIDYYSKLGSEYHIIDKERFLKDKVYKEGVIRSNKLDNLVLIDIATQFIDNFKKIAGVNPKTIFTAGSIARSYLLSYSLKNPMKIPFKSIFRKGRLRDLLLDYSMQAYHGGKIDSYVLGYIKKGYITDITSAYPYALSRLPQLTNKIVKVKGDRGLDKYFYAFIKCDVFIKNENLIHPLIIKSPINLSNISPYGYLKEIVITKIEYDFLKRNKIYVKVHDFVAIEHKNNYPYKKLIDTLIDNRFKYTNQNKALSDLFKTITNSIYGIHYELSDVYLEYEGEIKWIGFRAGDYFNPVIASYITAFTRIYISNVNNNIIRNGGEVYLNMTDSIIFNGNVKLNVFSNKKKLGWFEKPTEIKDIIILGAGRYEYLDTFKNKFVIKNRGFNVKYNSKGFYNNLDLSGEIEIDHLTFVSSFKATQKKFSYKEMGHLIDDKYIINPFNLGGKRVVENPKCNLSKEYTKTKPIFIEKDYYK